MYHPSTFIKISDVYGVEAEEKRREEKRREEKRREEKRREEKRRGDPKHPSGSDCCRWYRFFPATYNNKVSDSAASFGKGSCMMHNEKITDHMLKRHPVMDDEYLFQFAYYFQNQYYTIITNLNP